jgi:hypothetical protein
MGRPSLDVTRVEVKIFDKDRETLISHYRSGWTGKIRELVAEHCEEIRQGYAVDPITVGDLLNE